MIYVTVGTLFLDFKRLVTKMDEIAENTGEDVLIQTGLGETLPKCAKRFDFKPHEEVCAIQRDARVIVCHGGIGSVLDALAAHRPLLVVPRLTRFNEHLTDHQVDLAEAVDRRGWGRMILDIDELGDACANPPQAPAGYQPAKHRLVEAVRDTIERVAAANAVPEGA